MRECPCADKLDSHLIDLHIEAGEHIVLDRAEAIAQDIAY